MNEIEKYYNKFNEDKRLETRHGIVEFTVSVHFIQKYLTKSKCDILDVGAGTGKYSAYLSKLGHNVTAVELVQKNLSVLKEKYPHIKAIKGNALNLKKFRDKSFDVVILFGPLYHLFSVDDKVTALLEARRVLKDDGILFVAYLLSDYAFIRHAIMDNNLSGSIQNGKIDKNYNIITAKEDLYSFVKLKDINKLNKMAKLKRIKIFSPDGATDYIRPYINKLNEEDFNTYIDYQIKNASRHDLIGAGSHIVDILKKD